MLKTHNCGELRPEHVGQTVTLAGWVHRRRDHGGLIFIDLRDRFGLTQVVCDSEQNPLAHDAVSEVRSEYVLQVQGAVRGRPEGLQNPQLPTGAIEVSIDQVQVLNPARTPPFYINEDSEVNEVLRLKYRYLDLRRANMQRNLMLRHKIVRFIREFLSERDFIDIETPILMKSTPEGARDYVVPSRVHPGEFYALPQSPQQLKQLLMVSGFERYFQIARCFRDEDLRADRQPEFTQLDVEMSFVEREDILQLTEDLFTEMVDTLEPETGCHLMHRPFPRLTYAEAMDRYGSDKPDLRFGLELVDLTSVVAGSGFRVFSQTAAEGGQIKALCAPGCGSYSRREIDELTVMVKQLGAKGLAWIAMQEAPQVRSPIAKFLSEAEIAAILKCTEAGTGDLILIVADQPETVAQTLGALRLEMGQRLGLLDDSVLAFAWVVEFPLLEWDDEESRWTAVHHPFTSALEEDWPALEDSPDTARAEAYDIICNGVEVGGGSIRIHDRQRQERLFRLLGIGAEEAQAQFGHLLDAFEYGAPPHGGIAPGIDRVAMVLTREHNIREVVAFPKTASAADLMTGSPSPISERQLADLSLRIVSEEA